MTLWKNNKITPMLLKEIDKPFSNSDYIYEIKFDGVRALIFVSPSYIKIQSRNKEDLTYLFPELQSLKKLVTTNVILLFFFNLPFILIFMSFEIFLLLTFSNNV